MHYSLLENINSPEDLRKLTQEELPVLSDELRDFIIEAASVNSGHLGANLGVVELTVALHYVFNTPEDKIVWDVGHQAYVHKILTCRRNLFKTNRKYKGISGFPNRSESEYDVFGTGHSSTSISAALGIATAFAAQKAEKHAVAVIGDGSLTGGEAFEALNNAGISNANLLVILNDNNMAIDPNVGALKEYLLDITTSRTYNRLKTNVWSRMESLSGVRGWIRKIRHGIKSILLRQSILFESLNFRYFGPIDGHDVIYLTRILKDLKQIPGPKILHVLTVKGKGYKYAEENQTRFHAPGCFDVETGEPVRKDGRDKTPLRYQDVFGNTLQELARNNPRIMVVTPAMCSGSGLNGFQKEFPDRIFDVGIAEPHAVTFSAGLATQGMIPFCVIYSSFMQRAYDQLIHDVALQKLPVVICLDRAGLVGEDGATHHGAFDLAFSRFIPNITIAAPMDCGDLRNLMFTAQDGKYGAFIIRYPKGRIPSETWETPFQEITPGTGRCLREGKDAAVLSLGSAGISVKEAAEKLSSEGIEIGHFDMRFLKPLDTGLLHRIFREYKAIFTLEDGVITGGLGTAVMEFMADHQYTASVKRLGIPGDRFIEHGDTASLKHECGYDAKGIYNAVKQCLSGYPSHE
ncbi:MAG: 1-deoxy-D-xylulose-5-phosphate synthase [Bacteroidales bacterium]|nr:1-deoxy-D-xylulose-5-phosphate synthase [Bacteroidales bacterium]